MEDSAAAATPVSLFKKKGVKGRAMANFRRRVASPPPPAAVQSDNDDGDDDDSDGFYSYSSEDEDEAARQIKRRKTNTGTVTASSRDTVSTPGGGGDKNEPLSAATVFTADRSVPLTNYNDATRQNNYWDEDVKDALKDALSEKNPLGSRGARLPPDGTYRGLAHQASFIQKNPDAPTRTVGPMKAPANVRTVTVTDYSPDVCKDYKQTGFCGFGDNCKFLHAREDYAQGWELDKEWEDINKGKKKTTTTTTTTTTIVDEDKNEDKAMKLENIPFACIICKGPYKSPVVTRCGHYFCEACALTRYRRDPTCAACGSGTNGVFNGARRLQKLLDRKQRRTLESVEEEETR